MYNNKLVCLGLSLGITLSLCSGSVLAADPAPVYDLSQGGYATEPSNDSTDNNNSGVPRLPTVDASELPLPDRVTRVEQQVNNLIQMNMPQQIAELQQQVQQLTGQLQELSHQQDMTSQQQQRVEALPATPPPDQQPPNPAILNAAKPPTSEAKPTNVPPQTDATAYQQAFDLMANKQYDQAAAAFKEYLRRHPDGQFVANAHYWLGDIYFQQKNLTQSEAELNLVITQYTASGKAPDASLKLALLHAQQGKTEQAKQELKNIMSRYPGTSAAQLANIQLQQLNSAGGQ